MHAIGPRTDDRHLAGRTFDATISLQSVGAALALGANSPRLAALTLGAALAWRAIGATLARHSIESALSGRSRLAALTLGARRPDRARLASGSGLTSCAVAHRRQLGIHALVDFCRQLGDATPQFGNRRAALRLNQLAFPAPLAALVGDDLAEGLAERVRQHGVRFRLPC
jgi:hypothetical protein